MFPVTFILRPNSTTLPHLLLGAAIHLIMTVHVQRQHFTIVAGLQNIASGALMEVSVSDFPLDTFVAFRYQVGIGWSAGLMVLPCMMFVLGRLLLFSSTLLSLPLSSISLLSHYTSSPPFFSPPALSSHFGANLISAHVVCTDKDRSCSI